MVSNINIKNGYELEFEFEGNKYCIEFYYFIEFLRDYYTDDMIENSDSICDMIGYYASTYDLLEIIRLVEELDASVNNYEYIILDATYYYSNYVNDFIDLSDIYDLSDVVENICNDKDHLDYYCDKV